MIVEPKHCTLTGGLRRLQSSSHAHTVPVPSRPVPSCPVLSCLRTGSPTKNPTISNLCLLSAVPELWPPVSLWLFWGGANNNSISSFWGCILVRVNIVTHSRWAISYRVSGIVGLEHSLNPCPIIAPFLNCFPGSSVNTATRKPHKKVAQRVAQKSFCRACELFCCPIDALQTDKVTWCHQPAAAAATQVALENSASTILIVNISNSTLIDCVIGSDNYLCALAEGRPLMWESQLQMQDRCSCSCEQQGAAQSSTPPPLNINVHSSHLNCVIIGDNNYMHAEQTHLTEAEEPRV
ncbi:uncharacterized protein AB9W97_016539 [Spinachia spinachia]